MLVSSPVIFQLLCWLTVKYQKTQKLEATSFRNFLSLLNLWKKVGVYGSLLNEIIATSNLRILTFSPQFISRNSELITCNSQNY